MKKSFIIIGSILLLTACGQTSKKGAWNKEDKDKANQEIKKVDADLSILGDKKQAYVDCYLEKLENNYDNFTAADSDEKGCAKLAVDCVTELMK
jgi:hypothetical protein